jgi:hypothetical protein
MRIVKSLELTGNDKTGEILAEYGKRPTIVECGESPA